LAGRGLSLIFWSEHLVLGKNGRDGFGGYGTPHKFGELPAVVDVGNLETDDKPETEAGDADQGITYNIDHK
jgi:hypothetical protein